MTQPKIDIQVFKDCIKYGDFTLHSGQKSSWIFDALLGREHWSAWLRVLQQVYPPVGIEFGGSLLAQTMGGGIIRQDGTYYEPRWLTAPTSLVSLIDDVCTTEASFNRATAELANQGIKVGEYLCLLDRRKLENKTLGVRSLVTAEGLGLEP